MSRSGHGGLGGRRAQKPTTLGFDVRKWTRWTERKKSAKAYYGSLSGLEVDKVDCGGYINGHDGLEMDMMNCM